MKNKSTIFLILFLILLLFLCLYDLKVVSQKNEQLKKENIELKQDIHSLETKLSQLENFIDESYWE
jgi:predicted RND superfamily exporter protein